MYVCRIGICYVIKWETVWSAPPQTACGNDVQGDDNMEQEGKRKFTALEAEVLCECKTIAAPLDYSMDMHNHDGYELVLILGGIVNIYTEFGGVRMERGDLVCMDVLEFHRVQVLTKGSYDRIVVNVKKHILEAISTARTDLRICFQRKPSSPLNVTKLSEKEISEMEVCAHGLQESLAGKKPGDEILSDAYLKMILVIVNRHFMDQTPLEHREIMPDLVRETFHYIETHLEEEITIKSLEENLHYNGTYISRRFKRLTGISLQDFIITKKVSLCCKLLRVGVPPCQVCDRAGFNSYSNFSRTFSKRVGMSPKQYQMENK